MFVTLPGIATLLSPSKLSNAYSPMVVTPSGIVTSPFTPLTSIFPSFVSRRPETDLYD